MTQPSAFDVWRANTKKVSIRPGYLTEVYDRGTLLALCRHMEGEHDMPSSDFYRRYMADEDMEISHFDQHTWACCIHELRGLL